MKMLSSMISSLFALATFSLLFVACSSENDDLDSTSSMIDELNVYELVNGKRVISQNYSLLSVKEYRDLIEKGWIEPSNGSSTRTYYCKWADSEVQHACSGVRCGVITAPVNQVCLGCFDADDNLIEAYDCRPKSS